ncbi:PIN domain-containing protein [Merismopedia glauca]|uniref:Twitching motility protein PilT n=1 Tax=Merismopedia glauca CCAP 1448/3 TaxID=1296344 RepID=A0A2T1BZW5_9CYAN|nr:type II toxin-antitoxin system VapC family toxin [Merismopedia glauca]PSB01532.1 twitching motility protein PilT [Merismopedia glauca CCAP 1448/3]
MISLDTNVLVRYLTRDDEEQWAIAHCLIQEQQPCLITNIALCEMVWVLKGKAYGYSISEILNAIEAMLQSPAFEFEHRSCVYQALQRTRSGKADFSDYLIGSVSQQLGATVTVSFDQKLESERGFEMLSDN